MKNYKILKRLLPITVVFSLMATSLFANAASYNFSIDNDTTNTAYYYNVRYGFSIYVSGASHYANDCRRGLSRDSSQSYYWMRNTAIYSTSPISIKAGVYLNNTLFTDTAASYWVQQISGVNTANYRMFYLNQNTAPGGWSYRTYTLSSVWGTSTSRSVKGVCVIPSGTGSGYTGADAVHLIVTT